MPRDPNIQSLPPHLRERVSVLRPGSPDPGKPYVLYWMHHALRDHEHPALDVALCIGNRLGIPVRVYQGLGGRHPTNADRHHRFILQGAREVQRGLRRRGIAYDFHLPADPAAPSPLRELADEAALVLTESFPVPPFTRWVAALAHRVRAPLWTVDCSCVLPMPLVTRRFERAYRFREHTKVAYRRRIHAHWPVVDPELPPYTGAPSLPALDLQSADLAELCAGCRIDHTIGPVAHTVGGSTAGYRRWEAFKRQGLKRYAQLRNDAAVAPPLGVSRLSPYLHYGMVSPLRIAREAAAAGSKGADKFLDELLIWRELAHNFCWHSEDPERFERLPAWARETLERHADDPRPALLSAERLARARSGDPLWDAAQRSLLRHGELHNNLRMTWGKALLQWTPTPQAALRRMIDLNHRYALDGCDPNSYGGILWCLGLFDRPFTPAQPILGRVRSRSLAGHRRRIDLARYTRRTDPPASGRPLAVAVVGAGLAGLTAARTLADAGHAVTVYERASAPGGRLGRIGDDPHGADGGAQYFTVRDERFHRQVALWLADGRVAPWSGRLGSVAAPRRLRPVTSRIARYVGVPAMQRLTETLAEDLRLHLGRAVSRLERVEGRWRLHLGSGPPAAADILVLALPAPRAAALLPEGSELRASLDGVAMQACWAVLARFDAPLPISFDGLFLNEGPLSWAARENSKPGRGAAERWVLHGARGWPPPADATAAPEDADAIAARLLQAFFDHSGCPPLTPVTLTAHRWTHAIAPAPLDTGALWSPSERLGVCGDWCHASRVEGAYLSGTAVAGRILSLGRVGGRLHGGAGGDD